MNVKAKMNGYTITTRLKLAKHFQFIDKLYKVLLPVLSRVIVSGHSSNPSNIFLLRLKNSRLNELTETFELTIIAGTAVMN